jgi:putative peptide zinc metalloprotease protein
MLSRQATPTFSEVWYRVATSRPRLSPHASIIRQRFGGTTAFVVEEPANGTFFRMSEAAYRFAGLLDGRRTVDEAWEACAAQIGDDAPTQSECIELLATLDSGGLLLGQAPIWADMLEHRQASAAGARRAKRAGSGLFPCLPLINPEPMLARALHLYRWIFGPIGLSVWAIVVLAALFMLGTNIGRFADELDLSSLLDPRSVALLGVVFLVLRIIHELGHAMACKALGGRCTELGLMLVALVLPLPYCDATSSWKLSATWKRIVVAAGGVYLETFFAAIAAILWARSDPGTFSAICRNVMLISGVSTIVFNLNPLLRYDGYYILSDLLGIPNLAQRANELLKHATNRHAFGVTGSRPPPIKNRRELAFVSIYAVLSTPYRVLVSLTICLVVAQRYSSLGLVLGAACVAMMIVWPLLRAVGFLLWSPMLVGRRMRATGVVAGAIGVIALIIGFLPVRDRVYAPAWIRARQSAVIRAAENGYVTEVLARVGEDVESGDPLIRMESEDLRAAHAAAIARLAQANAALDEAAVKSPADRRAAEAQLLFATEELADSQSRLDSLTIRATVSGRLVASGASAIDWDNLPGSFVSRGAMLGHVSTVSSLEVRALVDDRDFGHAFEHDQIVRATFKARGRAHAPLDAEVVRVAPAGSMELDNPALANVSGGDVAVTQGKEGGYRSLTPQFAVDLRPASGVDAGLIGQRARVRLELEPAPLARQWSRTLRQFWNSRFGG